MRYEIVEGVPPSQVEKAVNLFWQTFRNKLHRTLKPETKALRLLNQIIDPNFAISALTSKGELIGVAGYKTRDGSFMGGNLRNMIDVYGLFGGVCRGVILELIERPLEPETLLMDGIFVDPGRRGGGVGSSLLKAILGKADELDCKSIRLDVIAQNSRARALYERMGFIATKTSSAGLLRNVFGFQRSTTMIYKPVEKN